MSVYILTWQLNSLQTVAQREEQESRIVEALKPFEAFRDPSLAHVWFLDTTWGVAKIHRHLYKYFTAPDRYIMSFLDEGLANRFYGGEFGAETLEWLDGRVGNKQYLRR